MSQTKTNSSIFQRVEKKYLLTKFQYQQLNQALSPYMKLDDYGLHTICNIYYDTKHYDLIRTSIDKPVYKEKLRLRSYGIPNDDDKVYLEIKKKWNGVVYKRRIPMTLLEANRYLNNGIKPTCENQIRREIDYFISFYKPEPKVYLAYDRMALYCLNNPDIRITFDKNIRSRNTLLDLSKGDFGTNLLAEDCRLMEIKVADAYPLWLAEILSELEIYPISFSKYGNVYKEQLQEERMENLCLQVL